VGTYGIALLSRLPVKSVKRIDLRAAWSAEPRVAIDAVVCAGSLPMRVISTHADVWTPAPNISVIADQLAAHVSTPTIVMGDLNVRPDAAATHALVSHGLVDLIGKLSEGPTFWSDDKRLDYLFVDDLLRSYAVAAGIGTSKASDHYPIWADFDLSRWTLAGTVVPK
jgi:endonuclease/exonuclease/phosphatase family metal-dependent hydrolase